MSHENKETYKEIMDNQHELRVKLTSIMIDKNLTMKSLSKEMNFNLVTLGRFLSKGIDITMINPLIKIREYVRQNSK